MSPVGASMYCSPHPAALHIAPAARLRGFASMILRAENCRQQIKLTPKATATPAANSSDAPDAPAQDRLR
jgi:hypothetical protein